MQPNVGNKIHDYFSKYPQRQYPKGQILLFADESPEHVFYLVEGRVRKYDVSYRGDEVIINVFQPPAYFPMSWAINKTPNRFFYKTETAVVLHVVPAKDAVRLLEQNPDVALDMLSRLYKGLEGVYGRLVHLMSGTAKSRLLYELIIECQRFGERQPDGSYVLSSSEVDLAARSGLSRETISREMKNMKKVGWVQMGKHVISIKDVRLLEQALGS